MSRPRPEKTRQKQAGRWQKGESGNPAGRPTGSRHAALAALDAIGTEGAADTLRAVVAAAKDGDMRAADILLRRLWPERKGRPVPFALPEVRNAAEAVPALGALLAAVASGELSPDEGQAVAQMIELHRRALETAQLERRIAVLEGAEHARD